jgi:ribonuclease VapC
MFLDASAAIAIIAREGDAATLAGRLRQANEVHTSPIAVYETVLGLARLGQTSIQEAQAVLDRFLGEIRAQIMPITAEIGRNALSAFERYGRGRHPAALNMGDCFAYACARQVDIPLLFKGDDFPLTDITIA